MAPDEQFDETGDPRCNIGGACVALVEDREPGISNCQCCGKQLELIDGQWWTWEVADDVREGDKSNAMPQHEDIAL